MSNAKRNIDFVPAKTCEVSRATEGVPASPSLSWAQHLQYWQPRIIAGPLSWLLVVVIAFPGFCMSTAAQADSVVAITVTSAVARALSDGPTARIARYNLDRAAGAYKAVVADRLPQVFLSASAPGFQRGIVPITLPDGTIANVAQTQSFSDVGLTMSQRVPFTGGELSVSSGVTNRLNLSGDRLEFWQTNPVNIQFNQPIFQFNQFDFNQTIETQRWGAARKQYAERLEDIAIEVVGQVFDTYLASLNLENARLNFVINDTIFNLSKGRFTVGRISENELLQSELAKLNAETELQRAQIELERARMSLALALGYQQDQSFDFTGMQAPGSYSVGEERAVAFALNGRSDLELNELAVKEAEGRKKQREAENGLIATFSASYGLNQTGATFAQSVQGFLPREGITMGIRMPILNWGAGAGLIEASEADIRRGELESKVLRQSVEQEVRMSVREFDQLRKQVLIAEKSREVAQKRYDVARNRYMIGKIDITELFIAQQEKDAAIRQNFLTARNLWLTHFRLRRQTMFDFEQDRPIVESVPNP